jgi:2-C-methyl-D-erythritol 4-phosphate cytidylyltransferase
VVVAGGTGTRFGRPKQFLELAGRPVITWSVEAARSVADGVVVVVPAAPGGGDADGPDGAAGDPGADDADGDSGADDADGDPGAAGGVGAEGGVETWGADRVVTGGASRSASVRAGLAAVPEDASVVVIHDAARPLAPASLFAAVVDAVVAGGADGAIPVVPVADTLKRVADHTVTATVDRTGMVTVQTPQAFVAATLRSAHASGGEATDDAGLLEACGATVRTVPGVPTNLKLTYPEDLTVALALLPSGAAS